MASLQPVYEKLKLASDVEIDLVEMPSLVDTNVVTPSVKENKWECKEWRSKSKCCSDSTDATSPSKCDKDKCASKKRSFGRRLCACACGFIVFGLVLWVLSGIAVVSYFGAKTYRCLHPRHQAVTEFVFDDDEVKEFDLGVASGQILITTCSKIEKTTLFVMRRASSPDLLDTMPVDKNLANGVFSLNVLMPSFDFHHCQHAALELVIPERLAKTQHYGIKAQAIVGKVTVNAPHHSFSKVSLLSNVGMIKADGVKSESTFEAEARVGLVVARGITAKGASLRSTVGYVKAYMVQVDEAEVFVETGKACLGFFSAKTVTLASEIGLINAFAFSEVKSLDAQVDYGRLNYVTGGTDAFKGHFSVESPYGFIDVAYGKSVQAPKLEQNTPAVIAGSFGDQPAPVAGVQADVAQLKLKATYAQINLLVADPEMQD